jgi:hypothetical protein
MKNKLTTVAAAAGLLLAAKTDAFAGVQAFINSFGGTATFSYSDVSSYVTKISADSVKAGVCWVYSSAGEEMDMYFRVMNPDNVVSATAFDSKADAHDVNCPYSITENGKSYRLQAKKGNFLDPNTYVSGTWRP